MLVRIATACASNGSKPIGIIADFPMGWDSGDSSEAFMRRLSGHEGIRRLFERSTYGVGRGNADRRHGWVEKTMGQVPSGKRVLDVGAGEQRYRPFCDHLEYVSQDFASYDGVGDSQALQSGSWDVSGVDIVSDIENIPLPEASFDVVLCTEVIEHVKYPVDALREMYRLLKGGGKLVLTAPSCSLTHMAPYHFYGGFNRYFYAEVLKDIGFVDIEIENNGDYFDFLAQELYRLPYVARRYSRWKAQWLLKLLIGPLLMTLGYLQSRAEGSDQLICFGFHVTAVKGDKR